jgi:hypothetical protein
VGYIGGLTTFRSIVKTTGHGYKKVNNRNILIKSPRLQSLKIKFLQYLQYKEQNALFVVFFFNETKLYQNGAPVRRWLNENDRGGYA